MASGSYDAVIVVSFGGPEGMEDVMPFLRNVTGGRNVPEERLREVAHHYELFGGVSPINEQNRKLIAALKEELNRREISLPVYFGNRNWHPLLSDTVQTMACDGVKKALAFVTSAYSSYSGCRQYLEDIEKACATVGNGAPDIHKLRPFFNHPGFIKANAERLIEALQQFTSSERTKTHVAFTAHSIPASMADNCAYQEQLLETARLVAFAAGVKNWQLVYQSRSGPPTVPWLEPNICKHLKDLQSRAAANVVVAPIGFVSDHMEVIYDLDIEAQSLSQELGIKMIRARTVGQQPAFIKMIADLIQERVSGKVAESVGNMKPRPHVCPATCCLSPA